MGVQCTNAPQYSIGIHHELPDNSHPASSSPSVCVPARASGFRLSKPNQVVRSRREESGGIIIYRPTASSDLTHRHEHHLKGTSSPKSLGSHHDVLRRCAHLRDRGFRMIQNDSKRTKRKFQDKRDGLTILPKQSTLSQTASTRKVKSWFHLLVLQQIVQ